MPSARLKVDATLNNTVLPVVFTAHNKRTFQASIDLAAAVSGGIDKLREKPILCLYAEPTSPLKHMVEATDKLIPLIHPYMVVDQGEAHHLARYSRYPLLGLLLQPGEDTDDEDIAIIREIHSRTALNFKSKVAFTRLTSDPIEEVAREIDRL